MSNHLPLSGVLVLELGNFIAAPYCGMLLADMGAEVIKVENPEGGDFTRETPPRVGGESTAFLALNRNKKSLTLNLKHSRGRELFLELAQRADVVLENFRPGTMADLGLDFATLSAQNPRLIYCSTSAYGQTGPYSQRPGLDIILQGMSGLMSITGEPDGDPVKVGIPITDLAAALFSTYAVLSAYIARERSGEGQYIDVSLLESAVALGIWESSGYLGAGIVPRRLGSAHRNAAPYQAVKTRDGYVTVGATTPRNWSAFCRALGLEHLERDPRFETNSQRVANRKELIQLVEAVTLTQTSAHWYSALEAAGVPCGVLQTYDQVLTDSHLQARGFLVELEHPVLGALKATGSPVHMSRTPPRVERAGPDLGEHTAEVLAALGCTEPDLQRLRDEGAV
jgi:formyl-CoA transferase